MLAITNHTFPKEAEETLAQLGHRTLRLPPHPNLPKPVASHPDMLLFFAPDAIFCTKSYYEIATQELEEISSAYGAPIRYIEKEYGNKLRNLSLNPFGKLLQRNHPQEQLPTGMKTAINTFIEQNRLLVVSFPQTSQ